MPNDFIPPPGEYDRVLGQRDEAQARVDELEAALLRYGVHGPACAAEFPGARCDCGLQAALDNDS